MTVKGKWRRKNLRVPLSVRAIFGGFLRCSQGTIDFGIESRSGNRAAFKVPIKRRLVLGRSSFEKFSWFTPHDRAWQQFGVALHPKRWSWLCRNQAPQCAELFR